MAEQTDETDETKRFSFRAISASICKFGVGVAVIDGAWTGLTGHGLVAVAAGVGGGLVAGVAIPTAIAAAYWTPKFVSKWRRNLKQHDCK